MLSAVAFVLNRICFFISGEVSLPYICKHATMYDSIWVPNLRRLGLKNCNDPVVFRHLAHKVNTKIFDGILNI